MQLSATVSDGLSGEIAKLKAKAQEFNLAFARLEKSRPSNPAELPKWQELYNYGLNTRNTIQRILSAAEVTGNVIDSIYYGITHPFGTNPFGLSGLAVLPLLPIAGIALTGAVIASALAAMTYFITESYNYGTLANATPEVRAQLIAKEQAAGQTGIGGALMNIKGILIVGALIYLVPKLLELKGKK